MTHLTAKEILGTSDLEITTITSKGWKGKVSIKEMSVNIRGQFEARVEKNSENNVGTYENVIIWLVLQSVVDPKGNRLFSDDDAGKFLERNAKSMNELYDKILDLNKVERAAAEEDEKN